MVLGFCAPGGGVHEADVAAGGAADYSGACGLHRAVAGMVPAQGRLQQYGFH